MNLSPHGASRRIGHELIRLKSVDSTNNYAMASVHAGMASHGTIFMAEEQTAGKGQRDKQWLTTAGQNITLSIVLEPLFLRPSQQFLLSAAVALGCYDFLVTHLVSGVSVKWPNDLYWNDRKAGGILIENLIRGNEWLYAVAGIGININQERFPGEAGRAVSLKQITGKQFQLEELVTQLAEGMHRRIEQLRISPGEVMAQYNEVLYRRNQMVKLKQETRVFETRIREVNSSGQLVTEDSMQRLFDFGQVQWLT